MSLRGSRRTKLVATLGLASADPTVMAKLFSAGVDVFRLDFSHGSHADHAANFAVIRELERGGGHPIGILADLQGARPSVWF